MTHSIRPETAMDYAAIRIVNQAAFGRSAEADVVDAIRNTPEYLPDLSLVAEQEGEIIAHVLFSQMTLDGHPDAKLLGLGPVAVLPPFQRRGIGGRLIREGLARAANLGWNGVILIGHPEYYPRFGFLPASRFGLRTSYDVPDPVCMALELRPGGLGSLAGTARFSTAFAGV